MVAQQPRPCLFQLPIEILCLVLSYLHFSGGRNGHVALRLACRSLKRVMEDGAVWKSQLSAVLSALDASISSSRGPTARRWLSLQQYDDLVLDSQTTTAERQPLTALSGRPTAAVPSSSKRTASSAPQDEGEATRTSSSSGIGITWRHALLHLLFLRSSRCILCCRSPFMAKMKALAPAIVAPVQSAFVVDVDGEESDSATEGRDGGGSGFSVSVMRRFPFDGLCVCDDCFVVHLAKSSKGRARSASAQGRLVFRRGNTACFVPLATLGAILRTKGPQKRLREGVDNLMRLGPAALPAAGIRRDEVGNNGGLLCVYDPLHFLTWRGHAVPKVT
jgi:hypothetical protein